MANGGDHPTVPPRLRGIRTANPPPRRRVYLTEENQSLVNSFRSSAALTPQERSTCTHSLLNLMTSNDASQFREVMSRLDEGNDLRRMVSLLTSDIGAFLQTARNANGSNLLQELLGKADDVDTFFLNAILRHFFHIMTDWNGSRVGLKGMRVFSEEKKTAMNNYVLHHAVRMAFHRDGNTVLIQIIDDWCGWGLFFYRDQILNIVAQNALRLSNDAHGSCVVLHVLRLNNLRCTRNIAARLNGHCVYLSYTKIGSYIVEKLLDTEEGGVVVVREFLGCDGEELVSLVRSYYGSFVVRKALRVMQERRNRRDLFWGLVNKLMPFVNILRGYPGRIVVAFLDSLD